MILASLATALGLSACVGEDDDFAVGRDTATVWLISPTPFSDDDGQVQLDLVADAVDWPYRTPFEHTYMAGTRGPQGWNRRGYESPNGGGGITISALDNTWHYGSDRFTEDRRCRECTLIPFDEEEALRRSKEVFRDLDMDLDDYSFETYSLPGGGAPAVSIVTVASLLVDGNKTDITATVSHRNEDGHLGGGGGHFVTVSQLGAVPIFTPAEALTLAGREATPEAVAQTELTLETQYDRSTNQRILIPVYSVPVTEDLAVDVTIAATRRQDIPYPEPADD
ncbi:MAG: hypothetical protein AAF547_07295 [Actinomycetota bacterium]